MKIVNKIFGSHNERELKRVKKIVKKICNLESNMMTLTDAELKAKTSIFKQRINNGETLDSILPEAFAVAREASKRVLNMRPYYVQLIGGVVLHEGRIAEMKTGEGKTLVAVLPAYLNALTGDGVYIVTVNEYLAKTQMEEMKKVYDFLGITTGCILHEMTSREKQEQYNCDVIYGTNNELGFDYLRDNMVLNTNDVMQKRRNFVIIDEADSILIDEARTPLIISGKGENQTKMYNIANDFVKTLKKEVDYILDEKAKAVMLTETGVEKVEKYFKIKNFADKDSVEIRHFVTQALKANFTLKKDVDYLVRNGEVLIIDSFTGRVMKGRRYSDGLHQAIEAKENVKIKSESKTYATITLQNYFKLFKKVSGMTGTANTEREEFQDIYHLDVVVIPTNKPVEREDRKDLVYKNKRAKMHAIIEEVKKSYKIGQPVLIGTTSVEKSEELSRLLTISGIPHQVLNAKYLDKEAEIISHAGEKGMITISTNMAGRGTDIKLGVGVKELGGLKVIGTERQESRRIDNQLRGRSGRQGDVGESVFFISLEDDLMRIFAKEKTEKIMERFDLLEEDVIESKIVTKAIENAQKNIEGNNFDIRKNLLGYDNVMNMQRQIIYKQRNKVLNAEDVKEDILDMLKSFIEEEVNLHFGEEKILSKNLKSMNIISKDANTDNLSNLSKEEMIDYLYKSALYMYNALEEKNGSLQMRYIEKVLLLKIVDRKWVDHLNNMEVIKQGIGLRAYGQHDPVQEYQKEGSILFNQMIAEIKEEVVKLIFNIKID